MAGDIGAIAARSEARSVARFGWWATLGTAVTTTITFGIAVATTVRFLRGTAGGPS